MLAPAGAPSEALRGPLCAGMRGLGLADDTATVDRLLAYLALIGRWNRVYNLTAVREPAAMLVHHLLDSLSAVPPLNRRWPAAGARLLDVGSGAGLPGVVIAVMRPDWQVTCVDAVAKKAGFLRQVAAELGLSQLRAEHARVEALTAERFELVTARAFSSLADLTHLTAPLLAEGGWWMAMKGRHPAEEIAALPPGMEATVEGLAVPGLQAERCLVWLRQRG